MTEDELSPGSRRTPAFRTDSVNVEVGSVRCAHGFMRCDWPGRAHGARYMNHILRCIDIPFRQGRGDPFLTAFQVVYLFDIQQNRKNTLGLFERRQNRQNIPSSTHTSKSFSANSRGISAPRRLAWELLKAKKGNDCDDRKIISTHTERRTRDR